MKKHHCAAVAAVAFALAAGCQPAVVTTPAKEEKGIHIRTPGANVDIEKKGNGSKVDVDVHREDTSP